MYVYVYIYIYISSHVNSSRFGFLCLIRVLCRILKVKSGLLNGPFGHLIKITRTNVKQHSRCSIAVAA